MRGCQGHMNSHWLHQVFGNMYCKTKCKLLEMCIPVRNTCKTKKLNAKLYVNYLFLHLLLYTKPSSDFVEGQNLASDNGGSWLFANSDVSKKIFKCRLISGIRCTPLFTSSTTLFLTQSLIRRHVSRSCDRPIINAHS